MMGLAPMLDQVAILATTLFCGAAVYITFVEQPARTQMPTREAARQFGKSYPRAAILQPLYIVITCMTSAVRCFGPSPDTLHSQAMQRAHVVNIVLMSGCGIWTLAYMLPGNKALLAAERQPIERVKQLLRSWGWQHSLRTVASTAAVVILLSANLQPYR